MYICIFSPKDAMYNNGFVDWVVGPIDTTLISVTK